MWFSATPAFVTAFLALSIADSLRQEDVSARVVLPWMIARWTARGCHPVCVL